MNFIAYTLLLQTVILILLIITNLKKIKEKLDWASMTSSLRSAFFSSPLTFIYPQKQINEQIETSNDSNDWKSKNDFIDIETKESQDNSARPRQASEQTQEDANYYFQTQSKMADKSSVGNPFNKLRSVFKKFKSFFSWIFTESTQLNLPHDYFSEVESRNIDASHHRAASLKYSAVTSTKVFKNANRSPFKKDQLYNQMKMRIHRKLVNLELNMERLKKRPRLHIIHEYPELENMSIDFEDAKI